MARWYNVSHSRGTYNSLPNDDPFFICRAVGHCAISTQMETRDLNDPPSIANCHLLSASKTYMYIISEECFTYLNRNIQYEGTFLFVDNPMGIRIQFGQYVRTIWWNTTRLWFLFVFFLTGYALQLMKNNEHGLFAVAKLSASSLQGCCPNELFISSFILAACVEDIVRT